MGTEQIIQADWTWTGAAFEREVQIVVSGDGQVEHVGPSAVRPTHRLTNRAILPGMINAHSHGFQRGLRGRGETFPDAAGTFWTWREAMYTSVSEMDADKLYHLSHLAFCEMLTSGITTVGEFHYLHHDATCTGYGLDEIVLKAARDAGIRLVLLNAYYNTGGIGKPAVGPQRRFGCASTEAYWAQMDRVADRLDPTTQTLGVAAHSIRAVTPDEVSALHRESTRRGMVFHMHVEEQRQEIEDCVAAYGKPPMALLNERLKIDDAFTAVHCTHTDPADMERFIAAGGNVCICPLTEANLGDGMADIPGIRTSGGPICIGTDSNSRLCMTEELRWLEYVQRLRLESRGVCVDETGSVAQALWDIATINGAQSLGIKGGRIAAGYLADFLVVDLTAPALSGWTADTLLDTLIFGTGNEAIVSTCVGGRWIRQGP